MPTPLSIAKSKVAIFSSDVFQININQICVSDPGTMIAVDILREKERFHLRQERPLD